MEATIKFNLDDDYDQQMYDLTNAANNLLMAVKEYDKKLRSMHKHEGHDEAYNYREIFRGILQDHNVNHLL